MAQTFGALLRRHRLAAGYTQERLAEAASMSARGVQDLERGVNSRPRAETVRLLTEALGLDAQQRAGLIAAAHPDLVADVIGVADVADDTDDVRPVIPGPPSPPTALLGREVELAEIGSLIGHPGGGTRLVTLTGPGGVGKTRLALEVAATSTDTFHDGVAWVELAALGDPALMASTVAQALGAADDGRSAPERLATFVARRQMLLVLDNLEHLLPAAPSIADLLAGCPNISVLVTSRARLQLRGEHEYGVAPLAVEGLNGSDRRGELADGAAVRLFVERAAAVSTGFGASEVAEVADVAAIAEICRRLDGLPLAIELAAARVKVLPPAAMLDRLDQRLPLLTGGARDAPARQRTMRDTIAWSYELLAAEERSAFRRLAIFEGGFTVDAAAHVLGEHGAVAGDHGPTSSAELASPLPVLTILESLVDQSLVRVSQPTGAPPRFGMLETIREFALELLADHDETDAVAAEHARCFLSLAERAEPELTGPDQALWLDRMDAEHANVRAAMRWALAGDYTALALGFVGALWHVWQVRGHVGEGRVWADQALASGDDRPSVARATALRTAGLLAEYHGDYERAVACHEEAASAWRALGDDRNLARTLDHLGNCAHDRGDLVTAAVMHEQALSLARKVGDRRAEANALGNLGIMAIYQGELATARLRLEETLALLRELGHQHGVGVCLSNLGEVALRDGDLARAVILQEQALELWRELGDQDELATALVNLGVAARLSGEHERAAQCLEEGRRRFAELGNKRATGISCAALGALADEHGDLGRAAAMFGQGLALSLAVDDRLNVADCMEGLAGVAVRRGHGDRAARLLGTADALRHDIGMPVAGHLRDAHDKAAADAKAAIDEEAFDAAWGGGRGVPYERGVAEALDLAEEIASPTHAPAS